MHRAATSAGPPPQPPGPQPWPILGSLPAYRRDQLAFLARCEREYGEVARIRLGNETLYLITAPDLIEAVLLTKSKFFIKDLLTRDLSVLLGQGLLTSEGGAWRRHRRIIAPLLQHRRMAGYADVMVDYAQQAARRLAGGGVRDVHAEMMRLTLQIVAKTLFGVEVEEEIRPIGEASELAMRSFHEALESWQRLLPAWVPTGARVRLRRSASQLDGIVRGIIERCRRSSESNEDLVSLIARATDEDGRPIEDGQLRDEAMTMLLAGHETTALALSYTLALLGQHPEAMSRLHQEVRQVVGERPATFADLPKLTFADAVIRESMRLYPPAWAIGREATEDCDLGRVFIPRGTQCVISQWVLHRSARLYQAPETFLPQRWLDGGPMGLHRFAYLPFGGGPRICIGMHFAMVEAVLVLATLVRHVTPVRLARPLRLLPSVTLRPVGGVHVELRRATSSRNGSSAAWV